MLLLKKIDLFVGKYTYLVVFVFPALPNLAAFGSGPESLSDTFAFMVSMTGFQSCLVKVDTVSRSSVSLLSSTLQLLT